MSHLIEIFGQLAPTPLLRLELRYRGWRSVNNFLKIGKIALSPSSSSDSEQAPNKLDSASSLSVVGVWLRYLRFSDPGATFGVEWWWACCIDLKSARDFGLLFLNNGASVTPAPWWWYPPAPVPDNIEGGSRSRSLSVSLWAEISCLTADLCRCLVRFFSETLRWMGAAFDWLLARASL